MEATALSVGRSVLDGALGYAKSAFAEEVALQLGIQRDHAFVADELEMMRSFMMVAHEERDDNKVVKTWVKQVRDTAYDVEDSLQDFAVRLKKPSRWKVLRTLLERHRIANQMKELRAKVEDVSQRSLRYRLIKDTGSKSSAKQSSIISAAIFGVDDARRAAKQDNQRVDLVQLISKEDEDPKVIAVWGTSGDIGQMSMIRAAYENEDVQRKFPIRAWVRVIHPFSIKGFVQTLVNQFHPDEGVEGLILAEKIEKDLPQEFNEYVKKDKCLIVLNELSTIEDWDQIKKCFRNNKKGSRIIVSTTKVEVASLCAGKESQVSELKQLSADQTLYAFYVKGSQSGEDVKKPGSCSDGVTTSTDDHTVASREIIEDQSKDSDEKVVKKSLSRIRTRAGVLEESQLIGREKEIADLNELISNKDSQQVQVISVYGMGGLGKTTLVDSVYQSQKLGQRFGKCVFVTIMRPFHLVELLRSLAARLHEASSKEELIKNSAGEKKNLATMTVEQLKKELEQLLGAKSCLIILDDLSSITEWDQISPSFRKMTKTSRIVVTTRQEDIAKHCSGQQGKIHRLEVLKHEEARHLFSVKVGIRNAMAGSSGVNFPWNSESELYALKEFQRLTRGPPGSDPLVALVDPFDENVVEQAAKNLQQGTWVDQRSLTPLGRVTRDDLLSLLHSTREKYRRINVLIESDVAVLRMNPIMLKMSREFAASHIKAYPGDAELINREIPNYWEHYYLWHLDVCSPSGRRRRDSGGRRRGGSRSRSRGCRSRSGGRGAQASASKAPMLQVTREDDDDDDFMARAPTLPGQLGTDSDEDATEPFDPDGFVAIYKQKLPPTYPLDRSITCIPHNWHQG